MTGAAGLAALAALRADAGYVTLAVPAESLPAVEALALEPVKVGWQDDDDALDVIAGAAARAGALALGPGLGRGEGRAALVRALLERIALPTVVDADALFALRPVERQRRSSSHPTPVSSRACSRRIRAGSVSIGSRPPGRRPSGTGRSSCSRAPTRSSLHRVRASSCATSGRRRSRQQERATC